MVDDKNISTCCDIASKLRMVKHTCPYYKPGKKKSHFKKEYFCDERSSEEDKKLFWHMYSLGEHNSVATPPRLTKFRMEIVSAYFDASIFRL